VTFEQLFGFLVLDHGRCRLIWYAVTTNPTAEWLARQITEAFPWDEAPKYCKYAPNIDPTSSSAHPIDIVRIFRMAEEPAPALVATPHEAQKNRTGSNASIKEAGVNIARDFTVQVIQSYYGRQARHAEKVGHAVGWVMRMNATFFRLSARSPGDNPGFEER
jgi:hypothetical protein